VKKLLWFALLLVTVPVLLVAAPQKTVAITGGRLLTVSHGTIENGVLVMTEGKIAAVGEADKVKIPAGAEIVDARGLTVYPGLIDPETNFGLTEIESDQNTNDLAEASDEIMPHMHVYDAFHASTASQTPSWLRPAMTPSPVRTFLSSSLELTATR
jgi:imidazolonepropionase-like amidohydrolase